MNSILVKARGVLKKDKATSPDGKAMHLALRVLPHFQHVLIALVVICSAGEAFAEQADLERSRQQREMEDLKRRQTQQIGIKREVPKDIVSEEKSAEEDKPISPGNDVEFYINHFEVTDSQVLTDGDIRAVLAPLEGRKGTLRQVFAAVEQINKLYKDVNYLACKAIVPRQKIENGVVKITLVEGRVGEIRVNNNASTDTRYIVDRIDNQPGELVELSQLEQSLAYFNQTNDLTLRAVLSPGITVGTTDFVIEVVEPDSEVVQLSLDNTGTKDSGLHRFGVKYANSSLFGRRDRLVGGINAAEGSRVLYLSYDSPISKEGTRLGASFDMSKVDIIEGELEPLNVESVSRNYGFSITHPIAVRNDLLMHAFAMVWIKNSTTDFDSVRLFETDVESAELGFDGQSYTAGGSWYTRHAITMGEYDSVEKSMFWRYHGYGNWFKIFENNQMLTLRASAQYSEDDLLPSSEQFQLGGMYSVRGYTEGLLRGDSGYYLSIEYEVSGSNASELSGSNPFAEPWRAFYFIDHGGTYPFKGDDEDQGRDDYLTSVGMGLALNFGPALQARVSVGIPIMKREDGHDDIRVHFKIWSSSR